MYENTSFIQAFNKISNPDWICIPQDKVSLKLHFPRFFRQYNFLELIVFLREKVECVEMFGNYKHHVLGDEVSSRAKSTFLVGFDRIRKTYKGPKISDLSLLKEKSPESFSSQ